MSVLDTGIKNAKNVANYTFGFGSISFLAGLVLKRRLDNQPKSFVIFFIDNFFKDQHDFLRMLGVESEDITFFIETTNEPTTEAIDQLVDSLRILKADPPCAIVGIGGGTVLDISKAVSNLYGNGGKAEDYQGWDLVKSKGIYKIGIPTISGTGAEATRTCVMTNKKTGLKLGMNSDYTVFDQVIMDPELTSTVPRDQFFYTGMDAYIHCMEALSGAYRNAIGDAFSREAISLCRQVFFSKDMMENSSRENLMVASYLGGCAIATTYVGLVHPLSAALSVVLGLHHCIANCIVMRAMEEYYPVYFKEFWEMAEQQKIHIPSSVCSNLSEVQYEQLYAASIIHEKPLTNALGESYKKILTKNKIIELFKRM